LNAGVLLDGMRNTAFPTNADAMPAAATRALSTITISFADR
jgi:hypothetical protein